jgi:hypothetical protein
MKACAAGYALCKLTGPAYNISAWTTQTTQFLSCSAVAIDPCLFVEPSLSNGCCMVAYFAVIA